MAQPYVCNAGSKEVVYPATCLDDRVFVPVTRLSDVASPDRNHAYVLPDDTVWILDHDGNELVQVSGSGTVEVGTVTTTTGAAGTSASVAVTSASDKLNFSFTIPRGATGAQGIQGEKGDKGDKGDGAVAIVTNVSVPTSSWAADTTDANFSYRATIAVTGATASAVAFVAFSSTDAISGNFSPVSDTADGVVYIYAQEIPAADIAILSITLIEESA